MTKQDAHNNWGDNSKMKLFWYPLGKGVAVIKNGVYLLKRKKEKMYYGQ